VRFASSIAAIVVLAAVAFAGQASATAEPLLPVYAGLLGFPTIKGPADSERYSWRVELWPGQELKAIDGQHAEVYYEDGHEAFGITAEPAHDASGATVPTDIEISEGDIVTLTVHHRDGNPAADGAPFTYPINSGYGWETGYSTVIVTGPKDEQELREERERIAREREAREATERAKGASTLACVVPRLKGGSLKADRLKLLEAGCSLGEVRGIRSKSAKVVRQYPRPGTARAVGAEVAVKLGHG
jgi:hypothetical protein